MVLDGSSLIVCEFETELVKYVNAAIPMTTSVAASGFAEVVEQPYDGNADSGVPTSVGKHVLIHLK